MDKQESSPNNSIPGIEKIPPGQMNKIKKVIAIMSGKGGVGKSTVTGLLAASLAKDGNKVGILDADITGPSIPRMFGVKGPLEYTGFGALPAISSKGTRIMSLNLILEEEDDPVVWRGPLIGSAIKQFWTEVIWDELDYLLVDLPPGTSDAPLTVLQLLPIDGIIVVTSPQSLVDMVVKKAIKMAEMMDVPVLGLIENYSYIACPSCGEKVKIFGEGHTQETAKQLDIPFLGFLPMDQDLSKLCDIGKIEDYESEKVKEIIDNFKENL